MDSYEDIINLPHPVSKKHPQMSMMQRAAQFAPFAALTGYDAAINEAARKNGLPGAWTEAVAEVPRDAERGIFDFVECP